MVYPVYRSIFKDGRKKINLLLIKTTPINENSEESEFDENAPFEEIEVKLGTKNGIIALGQ